ncbi:hypothetical protein [Streptomyces sp. S1D4-14]|uniref:hypothetical protein n=1 Tax=Streptomyces sp. S1D4-14 TaxID=2594461 RepID=UPI0011653E0C|nr:hypothetical protein [Streptomyces sp. S1D4-14]QDN64468.1 hypothetical protein FNV66_01140 [Streptomyces sp. S1D4-14]
MRTTWKNWDLADMQDAADAEGLAGLDSMPIPERDLLEVLPYYSAFSEFSDHVTGCPACIDDSRPDCSEGTALMEIARVGIVEQHITALDN